MVLHIEQLTGGYTRLPVIHNISFHVKKGTLTALIGLNGAGKSTLIKHIIGLLRAFDGTVTVNGYNVSNYTNDYKKNITYVPESPILYKELTLKEHIELVGMSYGLTSEQALQQAEKYLVAFRLNERLDWFPHVFSKGMKQKVMLILALMLDVSLYIIDEPFLGLDPLAIKQLLTFIDEKKAQGAAVLMSTHVLSTAEKTCDYFVFMHEGRIKQQGTLQQLKQQFDAHDMTLDDMYIQMVEEA